MNGSQQHFQTPAQAKPRVEKRGFQKFILIAGFIILALQATAPGSSDTVGDNLTNTDLDVLIAKTKMLPEPDIFEKLIYAIVMVECSGDTLAINHDEEAYGAFQIRPIRLHDYNKRTGKNYKIEDCLSYEISKEIFLYYAKNMGYPDFQTIARSWNGSGKMTLVYWEKVKKLL
jgi:hypothetical protein